MLYSNKGSFYHPRRGDFTTKRAGAAGLVGDSACRGVCCGGLTHVCAAVLRGRVGVCNLSLSLAEQAFAQGLTFVGGAVASTLLQLGNHELDEVLEGAG